MTKIIKGRLFNLSERQERILLLIAEGMTNNEIADQLCLSKQVIKKEISNICQKLEAKNKAQAVYNYYVGRKFVCRPVFPQR